MMKQMYMYQENSDLQRPSYIYIDVHSESKALVNSVRGASKRNDNND
jgi:hypothetical protein